MILVVTLSVSHDVCFVRLSRTLSHYKGICVDVLNEFIKWACMQLEVGQINTKTASDSSDRSKEKALDQKVILIFLDFGLSYLFVAIFCNRIFY